MDLRILQEVLWHNAIKGLEHLFKHKMELLKSMNNKILNIISTRFNNISQTIRSTIYKQGERNLIHSIMYGQGYEGVIEIWKKKKELE